LLSGLLTWAGQHEQLPILVEVDRAIALARLLTRLLAGLLPLAWALPWAERNQFSRIILRLALRRVLRVLHWGEAVLGVAIARLTSCRLELRVATRR
jgi:hypothetical protein